MSHSTSEFLAPGTYSASPVITTTTRSLAGTTLLMSGGSRGIGLAIALRAARDGANVAIMAKTDTPHPALEGTVHTAAWPVPNDLGSAAASDPAPLAGVAAALGGIRGAKSKAKVSMRHELTKVEVRGPAALVEGARCAEADLRQAGKVTGPLVFTVDEQATELTVEAELAPAAD